MAKEYVRDFYGHILGSVEDQSNGDKVARDFYGKILGYYRKFNDVTTDFYGKVLYKGDACISLVTTYGSK